MSKYKIREKLNPEINCNQLLFLQIVHIKRNFNNEPGIGHTVSKKPFLLILQVLNAMIYCK